MLDMNWLIILVLAGAVVLTMVADRMIQKNHPKKWVQFRLVMVIVLSVLSLILVGMVIAGLYQVIDSGANTGVKVAFVLFKIVFIAAVGHGVYRCWREWYSIKKGR